MTHVKRIRGTPNDSDTVDVIITLKEEWERVREIEQINIK